MKQCNLCPRQCGAQRFLGNTGICGETEEVRLARAALHYWEEPCISGTQGSGAVFFSGCALHCVYCQNHEIAGGTVGKTVSVERLGEIYLQLQNQGAHNINLVTAGHFLPQVIASLEYAKGQGLKIPIVYNTSSYETVEAVKQLEGLVDIYLPDFKYMSSKLSGLYSGAPEYSQVAKNAIAEMVRQTGKPRLTDEDGLMERGTIVRHLLLPGCLEDAKEVLRYLYETYQDEIYISIMNQFTPMPALKDYPELNHKVTEQEYEELVDFAIELGVEQGFIQEGETASESFIPAFDYLGL